MNRCPIYIVFILQLIDFMISISAPVTVNFRNMVEVVDGNECKAELRRTGNLLEDLNDKCNNPCFNRGILKFCEWVNKYKAQT